VAQFCIGADTLDRLRGPEGVQRIVYLPSL
jgi:hypothetical protein